MQQRQHRVSAFARATGSASRKGPTAPPRHGSASPVRSESTDGVAWLSAYIDCAEGNFDRALALALPLTKSADTLVVRTRAAVTAGSALRQLRRHNDARDVESVALVSAPERERVHLLIGLAADAVGAGDVRTSRRYLQSAERALPRRDWRARVRLDWVRCEHALLSGNGRAAVAFARAALRRSTRAGARRHEAKSLLFLGVALKEIGDQRAGATFKRAATRARQCGAVAIASAARDLLAQDG